MKNCRIALAVACLLAFGGASASAQLDTRSSVEDADYQVPFHFTGSIDNLTVKIGPFQLMAAQ